MLSNSYLLRSKIALVLPVMGTSAAEFWNHPQLDSLYRELLIVQHSIIRASVPLMQFAESEARARSDDCPTAGAVAQYLEQHITEERGHDDWLLEDLEFLGVRREEVLARMPDSNIASLVGAQYYWSRHHHPLSVLGYIAVLEGSPISMGFLETIMKRTGYSRAAFRTYFKHAALDPGHSAELDRALDSMPLTTSQMSILGVSAFHAVGRLTVAFRQLSKHLSGKEAPSPPEAVR